MDTRQQNISFQKVVLLTSVILFAVKIIAWYITNSVAVLTDALESIINIISAAVGLYSLYFSAKPKDYNHPYGHGKVEFISAAIEGVLILVAGIIIIIQAVLHLRNAGSVKQIDFGLVLVTMSAITNFIVGYISVRKGKANNSLPLIASGRHLQSDTWSTFGIIAGLLLIKATGFSWIDSIVALILALLIIYTGIRILRSSLAGIMDEADEVLLKEIVDYLNKNRKENWIDLHNLRIIKYGSVLHLDCHLTVPWFLDVHKAHAEVDELSNLIRSKYGNTVELFVHTDGCLEFSCKLCIKRDCHVRQHAFIRRIEWNVENISQNKKHVVE